MVRTPKYYADTLKDSLVMEDEAEEPGMVQQSIYISLLSMVRTPKYYADTLKDPLEMEDEAEEPGMVQQSIYRSCLWSGPPSTTRTH
jgi:hypothetical protein